MQICPKFHIASVSSDFKTTEIVRVFNKRYIIDTFSSYTLNEKLKIDIDFPSTLADSPTNLISRNSLTTACRRHKDRILRIHANGQQTINIRKRRSRCTRISFDLQAIIPACSSVSLSRNYSSENVMESRRRLRIGYILSRFSDRPRVSSMLAGFDSETRPITKG